ncbi:hypothetical protein RYX36_033185 [Vicia faba]
MCGRNYWYIGIPPSLKTHLKQIKGIGVLWMVHLFTLEDMFLIVCIRKEWYKKKKGVDPSLTKFYFHTHRKKDQSCVGVHVESAYDKFEQKKLEISSQNPTIMREDEAGSQPTIKIPPDLDIWV